MNKEKINIKVGDLFYIYKKEDNSNSFNKLTHIVLFLGNDDYDNMRVFLMYEKEQYARDSRTGQTLSWEKRWAVPGFNNNRFKVFEKIL